MSEKLFVPVSSVAQAAGYPLTQFMEVLKKRHIHVPSLGGKFFLHWSVAQKFSGKKRTRI